MPCNDLLPLVCLHLKPRHISRTKSRTSHMHSAGTNTSDASCSLFTYTHGGISSNFQNGMLPKTHTHTPPSPCALKCMRVHVVQSVFVWLCPERTTSKRIHQSQVRRQGRRHNCTGLRGSADNTPKFSCVQMCRPLNLFFFGFPFHRSTTVPVQTYMCVFVRVTMTQRPQSVHLLFIHAHTHDTITSALTDKTHSFPSRKMTAPKQTELKKIKTFNV